MCDMRRQVIGVSFTVAATVAFNPMNASTTQGWSAGQLQQAIRDGRDVAIVGYAVEQTYALVSAAQGGEILHDALLVPTGDAPPVRLHVDRRSFNGAGLVWSLSVPVASPPVLFTVYFEIPDRECA